MTKKKTQKIIAQIIPVQYSAGKPIAQPPIRKTSPTFKVGLFFRRLINSIKRRTHSHK